MYMFIHVNTVSMSIHYETFACSFAYLVLAANK